jgi:serine/threonine protein kinase
MEAEAETKVVEPRSNASRPTTASSEALPRGRLVGRYELIHRLGHGGMATVYLGRALGTAGFEKLVAVKVIHPHLASEPEFVEMFLDEARIAARIHHPHVVEILDLGREDDVFFMVMEYVEGDTLASIVRELRKTEERMPLPVVLQIVVDACEGLAAAHDLVDPDGAPYQLVHRDVSPHNLLVGLDGRVRVVDFGIMKAAGKRSTTLTGQLRGKLPYMSPEQAKGHSIDLRTDLFALGAVLWELCAGERLFAGETDSEILAHVVDCNVRDIRELRPDTPAEIVRVLERSLAVDRTQRYANAQDMLRDLRLAVRACTEPDDPRESLAAVLERTCGGRLDYVRAATRNRGIDRGDRANRSASLDLDEAARAAANDSHTTPVGPALAARASGLRGFPEMPTATTTLPGGRAGQWTAWILLPLVGAAVAIAAISFQREPSAAPASASPVAVAPADVAAGESTRGADEADTVKWWFDTEPQGAIVVVDGVRQDERTPLSVVVPRSDVPVSVEFEREGHRPLAVSLVPFSSQNFRYNLATLPSDPLAPGKPTIRFTARTSPKKGAKIKPATTPVASAPTDTTEPRDEKLAPNPLDALRKKDKPEPPSGSPPR